MSKAVPSYLIQSIDSLLKASILPAEHQSRVMNALKQGPRVRLTDLARHNKVHRGTVHRWIREGKLPVPRKDGYKLNTWAYDEVAEFLK